MALKVIGAGFGRTGTLSLKTALEMLGFGPCHHMIEIMRDMKAKGPVWNSVATGRERDWDAVYAGYRSAVDWPTCRYYAELAVVYPEAKVILTTRDPAEWYESMSETIFASRPGWLAQLVMRLIGFPIMFVFRIVFEQTFGGDTSREHAIEVFERHNAEARHTIPAERLLEFDVRQGWEPLCVFLGVPVPDDPFPRVNDREEFKRHGEEMRKRRGR